MIVQVNASQFGFGAALLQEGKPVAFSSKAFTAMEYAMPTLNVRYWLSVSELSNSEHTPMVDPSPLNQITSCWNWSVRRTLRTNLPSCSTCCCTCKDMTAFSITALVRKFSSKMHSHASRLYLALKLHWLLPSTLLNCPEEKKWSLPTSFQDGSWDAWSDDIKEIPHPLCCPLATLSITYCWRWASPPWTAPHCPSFRNGEAPWYTESVTPWYHQTTVAHHRCVFWPGFNRAIKEAVCQWETCTRFHVQNAAASLTPTLMPSWAWHMCALDIFILESSD